jgi:hypothetical protein
MNENFEKLRHDEEEIKKCQESPLYFYNTYVLGKDQKPLTQEQYDQRTQQYEQLRNRLPWRNRRGEHYLRRNPVTPVFLVSNEKTGLPFREITAAEFEAIKENHEARKKVDAAVPPNPYDGGKFNPYISDEMGQWPGPELGAKRAKFNYYLNNGKIGDVLYFLPVLKYLYEVKDEKAVIVFTDKVAFEALEIFLYGEPYIEGCQLIQLHGCPSGGGIDVTGFREFIPKGGHIAEGYFHCLGVSTSNWQNQMPCITQPRTRHGKAYAVINRTERYNDLFCNWDKEIRYISRVTKNIMFVGLRSEFDKFVKDFPRSKDKVRFAEPKTFDQIAYLIWNAEVFSGNQSSLLALAQMMGIKYRMEEAPTPSNCRQYTPNEYVINRRSRKLHLLLQRIKQLFTTK